jgi:hypothetical protein
MKTCLGLTKRQINKKKIPNLNLEIDYSKILSYFKKNYQKHA